MLDQYTFAVGYLKWEFVPVADVNYLILLPTLHLRSGTTLNILFIEVRV